MAPQSDWASLACAIWVPTVHNGRRKPLYRRLPWPPGACANRIRSNLRKASFSYVEKRIDRIRRDDSAYEYGTKAQQPLLRRKPARDRDPVNFSLLLRAPNLDGHILDAIPLGMDFICDLV